MHANRWMETMATDGQAQVWAQLSVNPKRNTRRPWKGQSSSTGDGRDGANTNTNHSNKTIRRRGCRSIICSDAASISGEQTAAASHRWLELIKEVRANNFIRTSGSERLQTHRGATANNQTNKIMGGADTWGGGGRYLRGGADTWGYKRRPTGPWHTVCRWDLVSSGLCDGSVQVSVKHFYSTVRGDEKCILYIFILFLWL